MPALTQSARDYENALIQNRQLQAAAGAARLEKLKYDIEKAREETMAGRAELGQRIAMINERDRQAKQGVQIGPEISPMVLESKQKGGIGLLEGAKLQSELDLRNRMEQGRLGAIQQYGIEKGILPSAKIDVGGITQTVPAVTAPQAFSDLQYQTYQATWPKLSAAYQDRGFSKEDSDMMAKEEATNQGIKNSNNGKVGIPVGDPINPTVMTVSVERAMKMANDPNTPKEIRDKLKPLFGNTNAPSASSWISKSLGR